MIYDDTYQFPWTPVTGATHDLLSSCTVYLRRNMTLLCKFLAILLHTNSVAYLE